MLSMDDSPDSKRQKFDGLVIEHHVRVRAFVRSLGVAPDWVDDIAQEAFMTAFREWNSFDQTRDFGKWLRGIAANIVRNEIRKNARRQRILHTELAEILLARQADATQQPEPLAVESIRDCLDKLPPKSRQVVQGRYRDGLAAPQLAEQLELSAANVRQMLVRIRRQLKECVETHIPKDA
jgi:RNA polymerase sigma-70 factor (ECF subfamily)